MHVTIRKWGNSAGVRIPSNVMAEANLSFDQKVDVREEGGKIIISPIRNNGYEIEKLLSAITHENLHAEVNFGFSVGKENI